MKKIKITESQLKNVIKNNTMSEQSLAAFQSGNGPGWWEEFGCIMDGIDGIKKEQGGEGTLFILSKDGNRYALVNTVYHKPDPALVKKVQSVNPNIKTFGKAINVKDKNEALVYYCQVKARGGIRVVGDNYTVEPPRQSKPAAQPAKPVHYNQSATNTSSANPAPINEEVRRIKKMMGVLNEQKEYEEDFDNDGIKFGALAFPRCTTWGIEVQVKDADYAASTTVTVYVEFNNDGDFVRVVEIDNQSDREDEEIVELVEYAIRNGKLDGKIPDFISYNMETGKFDTKVKKPVIQEQQPKKTCQFSNLSQFINELKRGKIKEGRWFRYESKPEMIGLTAAATKLDFQELESRFCNIQDTKLQLPKGKNNGRWSFDGTDVKFS